MILFPDTQLQEIALHKVGNKTREEGNCISTSSLKIGQETKNVLMSYFLSHFNSNELFNLTHESDIRLNNVYSYVEKVFENPSLLFEQSINIANHLYAQSLHPKIKQGELYVAYFKQCILNDEECDAIGIFKSESRDTFLNVIGFENGWSVEAKKGVNINNLDKGCLIFNTEKQNGYVVAIVESAKDSFYWKDEFIKVSPRNDNFFQTQETIKMCKQFIAENLTKDFEISNSDKAELLNKSISYFKENEDFDIEEFSNTVIKQPELIESFIDFQTSYKEQNDVVLDSKFSIENTAVNKLSKSMKSIIKLDKNFHVYIHGGSEYIERGYDESTGMHFYKLHFKVEN